MVSTYITTSGATIQAPPIVAELQSVFETLDDAPLLQTLNGPVRRGPKGHSVKVLWHCFVAKHVGSHRLLRRSGRGTI